MPSTSSATPSDAAGHEWLIRPADPADAAAVATAWLASWHGNRGSLPATAHSDEEVRAWVADTLLLTREVWVAEAADEIVAVLALGDGWLDQLYVTPAWSGRGLGTALLGLAKHQRPFGFGLWTFVSNTAAQRFYLRHGLVEVRRTDGRGNDEHAPDIQYVWEPG